MTSRKSIQFFKNFGGWVIKHRWWIIAVVVLLNIFSIAGLKHLEEDSSWDNMFDKNDPLMVGKRTFEKTFGNNEYIAVLVEAKDVFAPKNLRMIRELGRELKNKVPFADRLVSITDMDYVRGTKQGMNVGNIVPEKIPNDPKKIETIRRLYHKKKGIVGKIFSRDHKEAWILLRLKKYPKNFHELVRRQYKLAKPGMEKRKTKLMLQLKKLKAQKSSAVIINQITAGIRAINKQQKLFKYKMKEDASVVVGMHAHKIITQKKYKDFKLTAAGIPVSGFRKMAYLKKELGQIMGLGFLLSIIFLWIMMRSFRGFAAAVLTMLSAMIILFGTMGWMGVKIDPSVRLVPMILVLAVSIGYSIHVMNFSRRFFLRTGKKKKSVIRSLGETGWSISFTALTTIGALASFFLVPITTVRWMGLSAGAGVIIVYFLVMFFFSALISFGKDRKAAVAADAADLGKTDRYMASFGKWVLRRGKPIIVCFIIIVLILTIGLFKLRVDISPESANGTKVPYMRDILHAAKSQIGSMYSYELTISFKNKGDAKQPAILKKLEILEKEIKKMKYVKQTGSILDVIRDLNMVMHADNPIFYRIPDDRKEIAQYLMLYELSGGTDAKSWVDYGYRTLRMKIEVSGFRSTLVKKQIAGLKNRVKQLFPDAKMGLLGTILQFARLNEYVVNGQFMSLLLALTAISVLLIFVFKSVKIGLIAMIPNITPVLAAASLMGYLHSPIAMMTLIIGPMVIGLAVDDTIHFINHARIEFNRSGSYDIAYQETFRTVGKALAKTSFILVLLFSTYLTSKFAGAVRFGFYSVVAILVALLADYLITPILMKWTKPFGKERIGT